MSNLLKFSSIFFYALTFLTILWNINQLSEKQLDIGQNSKRGLLLFLWLAACILHAAHLYPQTFTEQGLNLSFFNAVSIVLFIIAVLLLILSGTKKREFIALFILPLVIASIVLTLLNPSSISTTSSIQGLQVHILTSLFAFSVLTIAAVQSIILFAQDRRLRKHNVSGLTRALPPLHDTEKFLFQSITVGFVLLTVALGTGFIFLENMFQQHVAHKTILSILAWIVFALLLWGRKQFGWRGQSAMRWTIGGFALLILSYLGSKFVQELILHRVASLPIT